MINTEKAKRLNMKLRREYDFIKLELDYTIECCEHGDRSLRSEDWWKELLRSNGQEVPDDETEEADEAALSTVVADPVSETEMPPENDLDEEDVEINENKAPKDPEVKKMFRKLVEKTHPDRTGTNDTVDDFLKAKEAYENNNLAELVSLGIKYNIDVPDGMILTENNSLMASIRQLKQEIESKQRTIAYKWYLCETEDQKLGLANLLKQMYGLQ